MAVLKRIKFGNVSNNIAKTVVTAKSGGVMSVGAPTGVQNSETEDADYQYELDVNVDGTTLVKSTTTGDKPVTQLAVGTVPAASVSVADSDGVFTAENVETALKELKDNIAEVSGDAKSYKIVSVDNPASTSYAEYKIQEKSATGEWGEVTGSSPIVVPKDNAFVTARLGHTGATVDQETGAITDGAATGAEVLLIEYKNEEGTYTLVEIPVGDFLRESEFKDGLQVNGGEVSAKLGNGLEFGSESGENKSINVKIDSTSETFLTVGAGGVKLAGVQDAIDAKVAALDFTTDAAVAGQYVAAIEETDGVVAIKARANVSDAVLTGYAKGSAPASGQEAVAATDDVKGAIAKLEHQVDAAKAAAAAGATVVAKGTDVGNNLSIDTTTDQTDGHKTYTINLTDVASAQGLTGEIARAQSAETAIDSAIGLTKTASGETRSFTPTKNYGTVSGTAATTVMGNMQNIDTALKAVSDKANSIQYKVDGTTLEFFGMTEKTGA